MEYREILEKVDHTLLKQTATWEDIRKLCDEAIAYGTASVCIPPCYVKRAKEYVGERMKICTVIGFPNGYSTTAAKVFETEDAIEQGADEIDMVININYLKDKRYEEVGEEIRDIKAVCGNHILKVIIETCLLTKEEIIMMCDIVTKAGADYIKTSTGFSDRGATFEDVRIMAKNIGEKVRVKAAGGISTLDDARKFMEAGADRLGTSRIIGLIKGECK